MGLESQDVLQLVSDPEDTFCPQNTGRQEEVQHLQATDLLLWRQGAPF